MALSDYDWIQIDSTQYDSLDRIEYKKIEMELDGIKIYPHMLREPDENGYYTDQIVDSIILERPNLTMINIGVGQGKTTAVHRLIKKAFDKGYKVIVAAPFTQLVQKYYDHITLEIPEEQVFRYDELETITTNKDVTIDSLASKDVHIMTINMLLGNPGESNFRQASKKRKYLRELQMQWQDEDEDEDEKVIIFFDEIHESIHNFKPELIYNLHKWKGVVHKCFFISATYTEPVFIAAYHVAYLTNYKIAILEAERSGFPAEKIAHMDLYLSGSNFSSKNVTPFEFIIDYYNYEPTGKLHILSYSKKVASELNKMLKKNEIHSNLVTSSSSSIFSARNSNIGTTFKTGIDIDNSSDLYVIILPPFQKSSDYIIGKSGIFSDGIPSIIQSVARKRNGGKILVVLPMIKQLLLEPASGFLKTELLRYFLSNVKMHPPESQDEFGIQKSKETILREFHAEEYYRLSEEIRLYEKYSKEHPEIPHVYFPRFEDFVLKDGQRFLVEHSPWYGKNIVPYFIWAAMNDQFINAKLKTIYCPSTIRREFVIDTRNLQSSIEKFCEQYFIDILPADKASYFSCMDKFMKIVQSEKVGGIRNHTEIHVDGEINNKYASRIELKQKFLELQASKSADLNISSLSEYLLHQGISAKNRDYSKEHHIGKAYLELYESLESVKKHINDAFPNSIPKVYTIIDYVNGLKIELERLQKAIKKLWEVDPYLVGKTWNLPSSVNDENLQKIFKFWRLNFIKGDECKLTEGNERIRVIKNVKFLHQSKQQESEDRKGQLGLII